MPPLIWTFLLPIAIAVAPAAQASSHYFTHLWQTEDGLPQNAVTSIIQTRDGYLWLGTYGGLSRFDGVRFTRFDPTTYPQLKSSRVTSLLEDRDDYLWVGHETGEVVRFKHGRFEEMPVPPGWKGKKIVAICEDELSDFWIVSDVPAIEAVSFAGHFFHCFFPAGFISFFRSGPD